MWLMQNALAKPDNAGAGSTDYMHLFGLVALGYMWAQMAKAAQAKLANGADGATSAMKAKLVTGRFFMERMLPETAAHLARIQTGADTHDGAAGGGVLKRMANLTGGCQCGAVRYEWVRAARLFERLPLPHVPEGVRPAVHGPDRRQTRASALDARRAVDLPKLEHGGARLLQGLRHAAHLRVRRHRPHQRDHQQSRRSGSDAADQAVRHRKARSRG